MAYVVYKFNINDENANNKIADVASAHNTTIEEIMRINNIRPPYPMYVNQLPEDITNSGYLNVPMVLNGDQTYETYYKSALDYLGIEYKTDKDLTDSRLLNFTDYTASMNITDIYHQDIRPGRSAKDCYIIVGDICVWFPCYPETVSDSNTASYSSENILGRSEPFQYYTGSGPRTVNVAFQMHTDMCNDVNYIYKIADIVESACYPSYGGSAIAVTKVVFHCSHNITITGIISNVNTKYSGPIIDNKYAVVDLDFSVTEVTGLPKSRADIARAGGRR